MIAARQSWSPGARAAWTAGIVLAAVYVASAAPDVTFWDAGEFLAAFATFGIPHPPGTPLFVALGRVWTLAAGALGIHSAPAGNLLAAACGAAAGACTAWLVARWTNRATYGVAAALCAGTMTTAWSNATEAEVYSAALTLACLALVAADRAGDRPDLAGASITGERATVVTAYALALAVPLHLSALVAAPAALWLACVPSGPRSLRSIARTVAWRRAAALGSAVVLSAGVGTAHVVPIALGGIGLLASIVAPANDSPDTFGSRRSRGERSRRLEAIGIALAVALALSATLILVVRARHDPWLNQGDPSTWARLVDVVGRRQYAVAGPWPRQAPWWLQIANLGEWADWQVALGLAPNVEPAWQRTSLTLAFVALGTVGCVTHHRRHLRSWGALVLLLLAGSLGVVAYLNLKAGPSFGAGVLADAAPHEARERDYFFVLAWWTWGTWAGIGAIVAAERLTATRAFRAVLRGSPRARAAIVGAAGLCVAALPLVLNWRVASRRRTPAAFAAAAYARALLDNTPPRAVLFVNGDNDTYPVWQAQAAARTRRDVTVVTVSLLPARWYRAELARRDALLGADDVDHWRGPEATIAAVATRAIAMARPLAVDLATDDPTRRAAAPPPGAWQLRGLALGWVAPSAARVGAAPPIVLPSALAATVGASLGDQVAIARAAARAPRLAASDLIDSTGDGVVAWADRQLACPAAVLAAIDSSPGRDRRRSLEGACRAR